MNTFTWVFGVIELGNLTDSIFVLCLDVSDSFFHVNMLPSSCLVFKEGSFWYNYIIYYNILKNPLPKVYTSLKFVSSLGECKSSFWHSLNSKSTSWESWNLFRQGQSKASLPEIKANSRFALLVLHSSIHLADKVPLGLDKVKGSVPLLPGEQHWAGVVWTHLAPVHHHHNRGCGTVHSSQISHWANGILVFKIDLNQLNYFPIGWSLFLKIDLNLMDIKSCVLFTELGRIVVESMVFYIGKSTPQPTHFGGKTMAC